MALHTVMDENSPTHGKEQKDGSYEPLELGNLLKHLKGKNPKNIDKEKFDKLIWEAVVNIIKHYDDAEKKRNKEKEKKEDKE